MNGNCSVKHTMFVSISKQRKIATTSPKMKVKATSNVLRFAMVTNSVYFVITLLIIRNWCSFNCTFLTTDVTTSGASASAFASVSASAHEVLVTPLCKTVLRRSEITATNFFANNAMVYITNATYTAVDQKITPCAALVFSSKYSIHMNAINNTIAATNMSGMGMNSLRVMANTVSLNVVCDRCNNSAYSVR